MKFGTVVGFAVLAISSSAQAEEPLSFEKELDALFATSGGLTADAAASRAKRASPTVRKSAASIDVSVAAAQSAELVRIPRLGATATYTRRSPLDPVPLGPPPAPQFEFAVDSYAVQGQLALQLSDYVVRYPKIIAGARLGIEAARAGKQAAEIDAGQEARIAYYEWVRAKLQV